MNVQFANTSNFRSTGINFTGISVKAGAGVILGYNFINQNQYPVYAKFFNATAVPIAGTDTPFMQVPIGQAGATILTSYGTANSYSSYFPIKAFSSGLYILAASGVNDSSSSQLGTALYGEVTYI